jgi:hypothetical protein
MADVKISGLPASTVPLAGTEVLPIVQGGATKQVSIANVTAGRAIAATSITTDTYKAASSSGGALQNSGGTPQLQWGAGGGNNLSVDVAININPANAAVAISPTGTGTVAISPAGALTINPTAASTINNVAIGGSTPLAGAFTTATANSFIPNSATIPTNGVFLPAANTVGVATNSLERARFTSSGSLFVGNTNSGLGTSRFLVNNDGTNISTIFQNTDSTTAGTEISRFYHAAATGATSATYLQFLNSSGISVGTITCNGTATLYNTTSDYRLKNVIGSVFDSGQRIDALEPIEYDFKVGGRTRGFLAHKFAEVYPTSVSGEKDAVDKDGKPIYQSMQASSTEVMADLIAEIQSLRKRLTVLELKS